ncbi:hypothetical protein HPB51_019760 [Rhipicephalus microplus]|uniref:Uncharacterized protein n=1 Tax=Rhipicephalus microplus TaxID=6941 RepID=A0A9J6F5R6_RHIMP|nr:hypothetical protein HPB51_019760 [Rhipicephalus microplus]
MEKQAMCSAVGESLMRSVQESKKELAVQAETTFKKEQVRAFAICAVEKFKKEDYKSTVLREKYKRDLLSLKKKLSSDPSNALLSEVLAELPPLQQLAFRTALQSMKAKSSRGVRYDCGWLLSCLLLKISSPRVYRLMSRMKNPPSSNFD